MPKRSVEVITDSDVDSVADSHVSRPFKRSRKSSGKAKDDSRRLSSLPVSDSRDRESDASEAGSDSDFLRDEPTIAAESLEWYDPEAERLYEEENWDKEYDRLLKRRKRTGTPATSCIIESLRLYNFMCHKNLSFEFGPQINFIIGHNGSGKSAVLAGLTIALGGRALTTTRGSNLQSFIKEGERMAEVSVTLANRGEDSFRHDVYGDSITISRTFSISGNSGYKITGAESNKTISTKREEVNAICGHMNIQVDNPFCILSQDTVKQFLKTAKPTQLYDLFMRGTQITQLQDDYDLIMEKVRYVQRRLLVQREDIVTLKQRKKEAAERLSEARLVRQQREQLRDLEVEEIWAEASERAKEVELERRNLEEERQGLQELRDSFGEAQVLMRQAEEDLRDASARLHEHDALLVDLVERKASNRPVIREKKRLLIGQKNERGQMNRRLREVNGTIDDLTKRMEEQLAQDEVEQREIRENLAHRQQVAEEEKEHADDAIATNEEALREARQALGMAQAALDHVERRHTQTSSQLGRCRAAMTSLRNQQHDKLSAFGLRVPDLLNAIRSESWVGEAPLGPLGTYVDMKPGSEQWAPVLRQIIGRSMNSFIITRNADRAKLRALLRAFRNDAEIIITERDIFDFSSGEPDTRALTILRILDIKNEFVVRILVNAHRIERVLLADTRKAGQELMEELGIFGIVYCLDGLNFVRYREGGSKTDVRNDLSSRDQRNDLFLSSKPTLELQRLSLEETEVRNELVNIEQQQRDFAEQVSYRKIDIDRLQAQVLPLQLAQQRAQSALDKVEMEKREHNTGNVQHLETLLQTSKDEKDSIIRQFRSLEEAVALAEQELEDLVHRSEGLSEDIREKESTRGGLAATVDATTEGYDAHVDTVRKIENEVDSMDAELTRLDDALRQSQAELRTLVERASNTSHRVQNPRPRGVIQRKKKALIQRLNTKDRLSLPSLEEVHEMYKRAHSAKRIASRDHRNFRLLLEALDRSLCTRLEALGWFRTSIAFRMKVAFQMYLNERSYYGKIDIEHVDRTLKLRVQTEDQASTQSARGQKTKEPEALSGGEKSFSLVCLLLAAWQSMASPLRCLDEFDVFMDAMNRKTSMEMMISSAREISNTQYILITPQDMSHVAFGPEVRVHRMRDPERQGGSQQG